MTATLTSPPHRDPWRLRGVAARAERAPTPRFRAIPTVDRPSFPTLISGGGAVAALRRRDVIAIGSLSPRTVVGGDRLVAATDANRENWWVPAESVWIDADATGRPDHPRPIGLATAPDRAAALVSGLSDRLGWEAVLAFERGIDLTPAPIPPEVTERLIVLDGRLGHDVPTVVTLGDDIVRWGAGATWDKAVRRAMFGHDAIGCGSVELDSLTSSLAADGLACAAVNLGTPVLERVGVTRLSVQLMTI